MKAWNHLNIFQRKIISQQLTRHAKLCEIADFLHMDPTSISREIKRHRYLAKEGSRQVNKVCKHTIRFPYVCNGCSKKYSLCPFSQYRYDAEKAQENADYLLKHSRAGINLTATEFATLDALIKERVSLKESIYHIIQNQSAITISIPTVYRYIHKGILSTKPIDLPYAVRYKKRKENKMYDYGHNFIDRSNRTFVDYLAFKRLHPNVFIAQMDFLGSIKSDVNSILTITLPDIHFVLLFLVKNKNAQKVVDIFHALELRLGLADFIKLFPVILTDRDPCFSDFHAIEHSLETGEKRTQVFFCDAFRSTQKSNVENMNRQLRKFVKKGHSIDHLTEEDVGNINLAILNTRVASLDGLTPREAFEKVYHSTIFNKLFK